MRSFKNFAVITPSYREYKSLEILLKQIKKYLPGAKVFVVDDSSTKENKIIANIVKKYKTAKLISRFKKLGRGTAIVTGFKEALKNKNIEYFFEMDSDLAHNPKQFERYLNKLKENRYDLIIGSRYLGGGRALGVSLKRKLLSFAVNKFLYFWLGAKISDFTGGFRLYNRKSVEYLTSIELKARGFIALSESVYKLQRKGFLIGEVPITINNFRISGKSTVNSSELFNSLFFVLKMRITDLSLGISWKLIISAALIFVFALSLRVATLNQIGRTTDEPEYVEQGYKMDQLLAKGDFSNSYFYTTYDHPPLVKYIYGLTSRLDVKSFAKNGQPVFNYDYTYSRLFSAILASLSAVLILLIAWEYVSPFAGLTSAVIFSTLPFFIGLSQLATTESFLMLTFTACVYSFIKLLKKFSVWKVVITGILLGLALQVKQSNGLLLPLFGLIYLLWYYFEGRRNKAKLVNKKMLSIFLITLIAIAIFIVIWPMPYFHLDVISKTNQNIWLVKTSPPVVFWGKLVYSPKTYYLALFMVTTPLLIMPTAFVGMFRTYKLKNWVLYSMLLWFAFPFIQSFYPWRVHGVRYIIEIYAPLSIISAIGISFLLEKLKILNFKGKLTALTIVTLYMLWIILQVKPYYLDYFNGLVGGPKGVYEHKYFELGWWGQGLREAGYYLRDNAKPDSTIGLFVSPSIVFPPVENQKLIFINPNTGKYNSNIQYDYVVVNYFHVLREGFDDSGIKRDYNLLHQVKVDGADLVDIYVKK